MTVHNVAPSVSAPAVAPVDPVRVGTTVSIVAAFTDPGLGDTHTAVVDWGDGSSAPASVWAGTASAQHAYSAAGLYPVTVTVTDDDGGSGVASTDEPVVVYDPAAGFLTAGGWLVSPPGASTANPSHTGPESFGIGARYVANETRPSGTLEFAFNAGELRAKSTSLKWLVVTSEPRARLGGTALVNGQTCRFALDAWDGSFNGGDAVGLRLFDCGGVPGVRYDAPPQPLASGAVQVHR